MAIKKPKSMEIFAFGINSLWVGAHATPTPPTAHGGAATQNNIWK